MRPSFCHFSAWVPNAGDRLSLASNHTWGVATFWLAGRTGVLYLLAVLLSHRSDRLVFQVNQQNCHFQSLLRAFSNAFAATIAFRRINYDIELPRTVRVSVMSNYDVSTLSLLGFLIERFAQKCSADCPSNHRV